jgi:hypothetical protein
MGNDNNKVLSVRDLNKIKTGHAKRDQVIKFVLGRVGILHGFSLSKDVIDDLVDEICKSDDKKSIANELRYVYACSLTSPIRKEPLDKKVHVKNNVEVGLENVKKAFSNADKTLLTGYVDQKL